MAPLKVVSPVSANIRQTGVNIVHGCPGVSRSVPRVEAVIELRPSNGTPFYLRSVGIEIKTVQKVTISSAIGGSEFLGEQKVYENPSVFRPPVGEFAERVLGLDLPVIIPLPRDITPSGQSSNWSATTSHYLVLRVSCGDSYNNEMNFMELFAFPVILFDTLPIYRQFNETVSETRISDDNHVEIDLSMPLSSVGPLDDVIALVRLRTNPLSNSNKKNLKLKFLTLQIKEVIEFHEGGLPARKEKKLHSESKSFSSSDGSLNSLGITHEFRCKFPYENDFLKTFTNKKTLGYEDDTNDRHYVTSAFVGEKIEKVHEGVPLTHIQGFTTRGKLYSISYEIIIKAKLSLAKDIVLTTPITVCPFDRDASEYLLPWIMNECERAKTMFGKHTINALLQSKYSDYDLILGRYVPPPSVFRYNKTDWTRLGFNADSFGPNKLGKPLVLFID